jgi:hypothetical protein
MNVQLKQSIRFTDIPKYIPTTGLEGVMYKILKLYPKKTVDAILKNLQYNSVEKILVKALATDPILVAQHYRLLDQINAIPELKIILNYMQDYGGIPLLEWANSKVPLYNAPELTRTTYTCELSIPCFDLTFKPKQNSLVSVTRTGGLMGLLNDIYFLETPQLPQLIAFFANAIATDMEVQQAFDLALLAGKKLIAMRTTPQYVALQSFFMQYAIDPTAVLDFAAFLMAKIAYPLEP